MPTEMTVRPEDARRRWPEQALSLALPTHEQTLLLRACLLAGERGAEARAQWLGRVADPEGAIRSDERGARRLLPMLFGALGEGSAEVAPEFLTRLRIAWFRDVMRSEAYGRLCGDALNALAQAGVEPIVLKGAALAETVYADPAFRHCHDLDLLVEGRDLGRAARALGAAGFRRAATFGRPVSDVALRHESGMPVVLHTSLLRPLFYRPRLGPIRERARERPIAGAAARILAPADLLLHVCGHALTRGAPAHLGWACDAFLVVQNSPALDWDAFAHTALEGRLALPLAVALGYLAAGLSASIPPAALARLRDAGARAGPAELDMALLCARMAARAGLPRVLRATSGWRARADVVRGALVPAPQVLRWAVRLGRPRFIPFYYLYGPLRAVVRRLRRART